MSFTLDTPKGIRTHYFRLERAMSLANQTMGALIQKFFTETLCLKQYNAHKNAIQNNTPDGIRIHYFHLEGVKIDGFDYIISGNYITLCQ